MNDVRTTLALALLSMLAFSAHIDAEEPKPNEPTKKEALTEDSPDDIALKNANLKAKISRLVSFEFVDTPLADAIKFLQSLTKSKIVLDPKAIAAGKESVPLNLHVQDMKLESALKWIGRLVELRGEIKDGVYTFQSLAPDVDPNAELTAPPDKEALEENAAIEKGLSRKLTFEFEGTPLIDGLEFMRHLVKATIIVDPRVLAAGPPAITIKVKDMEMKDALKEVLKQAKLEYRIVNQSIYVFKKIDDKDK